MIEYFIKTTFRAFRKSSKSFLINILGLSAAFTCIILVALWIQDEYSVDKFHENEKNIYQVMLNYKNGNDTYTFEWTPAPLSKASVAEIPDIKYATNIYSFGNKGIILQENNSSVRTDEIYASEDFFNMFSFELLKGEKESVLKEVNSVLLSDILAKRIFGTTNIVGETINFNQQGLSGLYKVSGVFKSVPKNSTLQFNAVFSFDNLIYKLPEMNTWTANEPFTFVSFNGDVDKELINTKLTELFAKKITDAHPPSVFIRPFSDKYLYNNYENGVQSGGRITYINLFFIITIFILIIAVINFINLSTSQAVNRVKEIGVKKALGVEKKLLIYQFIGESVLISFLALIIAIGLVFIFLPEFNSLVGKNIKFQFEVSAILLAIGTTFIVGFLSGIYPALYLSGFKTIKLLKGEFSAKNSERRVRQGLVVFQFTTSVFLIVAVIVITKQIDLVNNKELGYSKDQILVFEKDGRLKTNLDAFLSEVNTIPGVLKASSTSINHITNNSTGTKNVSWKGKLAPNDVTFKYILANYDFIELLNIDMIEGRTFSKSFSTERDKIILNETAVATMGLSNPIGETIKIWGNDTQVIGVTRDFHFQSLHEKVQPLFIRVSNKGNEIMIKIAAGSERKTIRKIETFYKSFNYGLPLNFRFLDTDYQTFYEAEKRVAILSKYFGVLAIILSCLGLFGLVTFNVGQRVKEIGVRKVLGASITNIVMLLSKDFLKLVLLSVLIAIPLSWLAMSNWLQSFAYRIEINIWIFVLAGFTAIGIAIFTISFQTIKAAIANPVNSLKSE